MDAETRSRRGRSDEELDAKVRTSFIASDRIYAPPGCAPPASSISKATERFQGNVYCDLLELVILALARMRSISGMPISPLSIDALLTPTSTRAVMPGALKPN